MRANSPKRTLGVLALIMGVLAAPGCDTEPRPRPNVILISIDCLNERQLETALAEGYAPALSELVGDSVLFTRAYAHAPWTTPSHMSLMTGLYPTQHGRDVPYGLMIRWNDYYSRVPTFRTLAERLKSEGYETAAFVGQGSISGIYGLAQGFDVFAEHRKAMGTLTDLVGATEEMQAWLSERGPSPFFLFFHTYDLHGPRPTGLESDRETIQYIDQYLSRLVLQLKSQDLYESSLIFLTGDHGSNMIETDGKCCVHGAGHYEENLRVPLTMKLPGGSESREENALVRHVDLVPTVLELAGLDQSYEGPGISLMKPAEDTVSFSEADGRCSMRRALVTERYKYIYTPNDETQALLQQDEFFFDETCKESCRDLPAEELYDLMKDPFEKQNLLEGRLDEARTAELERLRLLMSQHLNLPHEYSVRIVTSPNSELDEAEKNELLESLRTLGYLR